MRKEKVPSDCRLLLDRPGRKRGGSRRQEARHQEPEEEARAARQFRGAVHRQAAEGRRRHTGMCKRDVPCLKIPAPSAARRSDLPMHSPICQFLKVLAQFSELRAISLLNPVLDFRLFLAMKPENTL